MCRVKAVFLSERESHPAILLPAGIDRLGHGEVTEVSVWKRCDGLVLNCARLIKVCIFM